MRIAERNYNDYVSRDGFLAHHNFTVDRYGKPYPADTPLAAIKTNSGQSHLEWLRQSVQDADTVADLGDLVSRRKPAGRYARADYRPARSLAAGWC